MQLVPPGSACAIAIGTGIGSMAPGSLHGLHLIVSDIEVAREELSARGVELSDTFHFGANGQTPGVDPERRQYASFMPFQRLRVAREPGRGVVDRDISAFESAD